MAQRHRIRPGDGGTARSFAVPPAPACSVRILSYGDQHLALSPLGGLLIRERRLRTAGTPWRTAQTHASHILAKLGMHSPVEIAREAFYRSPAAVPTDL